MFRCRLKPFRLLVHSEAGKVVLMSTHTLQVAEQIADRVGVMRNGKVVFEGRVDELRSAIPNAGHSLESLYLALMNE